MGQESDDKDCGLHSEEDCHGTGFLAFGFCFTDFEYFDDMMMAPYIVFTSLLDDP